MNIKTPWTEQLKALAAKPKSEWTNEDYDNEETWRGYSILFFDAFRRGCRYILESEEVKALIGVATRRESPLEAVAALERLRKETQNA